MYRFVAFNTEVQDTKCSSVYSFSNINRISNTLSNNVRRVAPGSKERRQAAVGRLLPETMGGHQIQHWLQRTGT